MIVRCPDCGARYDVSTEGMDTAVLKVRCPRCKAVFPVRPARPETVLAAFGSGPAVKKEVPAKAERAEPEGAAPEAAPASPRRRETPPITDPRVARRLARAMVSEIVLNRQADKQEALGDGTLLSRFGPAILSAYREYEKRVSPRFPGSKRVFREAVNEILGDSRPLL